MPMMQRQCRGALLTDFRQHHLSEAVCIGQPPPSSLSLLHCDGPRAGSGAAVKASAATSPVKRALSAVPGSR